MRSALLQLAQGLAALHAAGKLDRDLKPSNVLVTREGRVVILDFGLVAELSSGSIDQSGSRGSAGAPPLAEARPGPPAGSGAPFVGRQRHIDALRGAFERARGGRATTLHIHGASGTGKTALVRRFLDDRARVDDAVILEGRCYERESVPYKAVDSLIDALSRHLSRLPRLEAAELMPRDVHAVVRLFPVLGRVDAIARAPRREIEPPDARELRRRGFAALREILARIADRRPLVLFIDDLQWGDADSAALLTDVLREPDAPALLLLLCYRSEDAERSELLARLLPPAPSDGDEGDVRSLAVGPLTPEEGRALALAFLESARGHAAWTGHVR
ncbi:AAA family ATPase [Sorangium sp. So ce302]|uniref:ATP-binding protein n=1 Tax=Sorangium sp. So ce302 TaxID=3133297 RepID=UPI003F5EFE9D